MQPTSGSPTRVSIARLDRVESPPRTVTFVVTGPDGPRKVTAECREAVETHLMMTAKPITEPALFARVRRAMLRQHECFLKRCSERSRWFHDLGRYYAHDERNNISHTDIDLEEFARELGVLRVNEVLQQ